MFASGDNHLIEAGQQLIQWKYARLLGLGVVLGAMAGIDNFINFSFVCPCHDPENVVFSAFYFILPALAFSILNPRVMDCRRHHCSRRHLRFLFELFGRGLFLTLIWAMILLLSAKMLPCNANIYAYGPCKGQTNDKMLCDYNNNNATDQEERCIKYLLFMSRMIGLALMALLALLSLFIPGFCCVPPASESTDQEQARQQNSP